MSNPQNIRPWFRVENAASPEVADLHIFDEISHWGIMADDFRQELDAVTAPTINLHLNSPGGYVDDGIAIYNILKAHPAQVNVFIPGIAASIATVIAMAGDRVVIAPHARMMIHNAWVMAQGDSNELRRLADHLDGSNQNIASIYAERAGGDLDHWLSLMGETTWFGDQEAVDAGLADEVGRANDDSRATALAARQVASFDLSRFRDGDRMVARIATELVCGDVLPEDRDDTQEADAEPPEQLSPVSPETVDQIAARKRAVDEILEAMNV